MLPHGPSAVLLMLHVTSKQTGGCHLQVGTRLTIVHAGGRVQEPTPPDPVTKHTVLQGTRGGIHTEFYNQATHKLCQPQ